MTRPIIKHVLVTSEDRLLFVTVCNYKRGRYHYLITLTKEPSDATIFNNYWEAMDFLMQHELFSICNAVALDLF